ncbi:hypothetical protein O0I10_001760 [Lichtheimia ornata]|uniref:Peptidase S8/S53 domain-containing protein n=1 Tax=Lichtheimia ornata TaxID=688661 RepID=A0AAD7Y2W8_9FUNG|nr:uncharacterized protein O0I10_001760 [Lichtheimia ornata]KAJ8662796.1 hypothetical protein O0I10_001760 [Lichtheimia ornata]
MKGITSTAAVAWLLFSIHAAVAQVNNSDNNVATGSIAATTSQGLHIIKLKQQNNNDTTTAYEPSQFIRQHLAMYRMKQLQAAGSESSGNGGVSMQAANAQAPNMDTIQVGNGFSAVVGAFDPAFAEYLHQLDAIDYVEPNQVYKVQAAVPGSQHVEPAPSWGIARINQRDAGGDLTTRMIDDNAVIGNGVHVYVFDTGINTEHPDLKGRAFHTANFIDYEDDSDTSGHGTHVAGIIGGSTFGVAPHTTIHSIKILDGSGDGTTVDLIRAIAMVSAKAERGKSIINLSLSGPRSKTIDDALTSAAVDHGIPVFVAAGNTGDDACQYTPAANPAVFAVGASDRQDNVAVFSSFGKCVRMYAPGVDITSSWLGTDSHSMDGTSMANPHVAGIAAMLLGQKSYPSVNDIYQELMNLASKDILHMSPASKDYDNHNLLAYTGKL